MKMHSFYEPWVPCYIKHLLIEEKSVELGAKIIDEVIEECEIFIMPN